MIKWWQFSVFNWQKYKPHGQNTHPVSVIYADALVANADRVSTATTPIRRYKQLEGWTQGTSIIQGACIQQVSDHMAVMAGVYMADMAAGSLLYLAKHSAEKLIQNCNSCEKYNKKGRGWYVKSNTWSNDDSSLCSTDKNTNHTAKYPSGQCYVCWCPGG